MINEGILLNSGYTYYENNLYDMCDKYYQKKLYKSEDEPTRFIACLWYDIHDMGECSEDGLYEFVLTEEHDNYWTNTKMYAIKDMSLEEIEKVLIGD